MKLEESKLSNQTPYRKNKKLSASSRLGMAFLLGALTAMGPLSIDMYLPALPAITKDFHTIASLSQFSLTACLFGLAAGQLVFGPVSDVLGRRKPLVLTLLGYAVISGLCALAPSIYVFIAMRFIQGALGAAGVSIARAVVRDLYSGTAMTKFFSLLMLITGVAPILAPVAGGQILKLTSWQGVFLLIAAVGFILFLIIAFWLPETLDEEKRTKGGIKTTLITFKTLGADRKFMGYVLSQSLIFATLFAYISGSPFVIQDVFGASPQAYSLYFAMNGLGLIVATRTTGALAGKISETALLITGLCMAAGCGILLLIVILLGGGLPLFLPFLFLVVSSMGIVNTAGFSLAMESQERTAGSASALLGLLRFVAGASVAPLVGIAGSNTAVPMGIVLSTCAVAAVIAYFALVGKRPKTSEPRL